MEALLTMVSGIIEELAKIQNVPVHLINEGEDFPIPGMIAAGAEGSIFVSYEIDRRIAAVAKRLLNDDPSAKAKYTQSEWIASVRRSFGPALAAIDLDNPSDGNAKLVLERVRDDISKQAAIEGPREHAFGCTLFSHEIASAIKMGPVRLETRLDWLERMERANAIPKTTSRRLKLSWQGKTPRKRKISLNRIHENAIVRAIGTCPYVCSVTTEGLASEAGKERALTAARIALTAIALLWRTPSKALNGFNLLFDRSSRHSTTLTFVPGQALLSGSMLSQMPHGPWIKPEDLADNFAKNADHFTIAGEIIEYILSATEKVTRPKLMNTFAQAILWFHEGCRESVNTMAIVKFVACMDGLSLGKKERGIRRLINAQLGIMDEKAIYKNGPTLKEAIGYIYGEGRSRAVHGTNDKLGHDWTGTRELAEQFARLCLLNCMDWAATNRTADDPSLLAR